MSFNFKKEDTPVVSEIWFKDLLEKTLLPREFRYLNSGTTDETLVIDFGVDPENMNRLLRTVKKTLDKSKQDQFLTFNRSFATLWDYAGGKIC